MPYKKQTDFPNSKRNHLSKYAQEIFKKGYIIMLKNNTTIQLKEDLVPAKLKPTIRL